MHRRQKFRRDLNSTGLMANSDCRMNNDFSGLIHRATIATAQKELELTPAMVDAGTERLLELLEAGAGSGYVAKEVFLSIYSLLDGV